MPIAASCHSGSSAPAEAYYPIRNTSLSGDSSAQALTRFAEAMGNQLHKGGVAVSDVQGIGSD